MLAVSVVPVYVILEKHEGAPEDKVLKEVSGVPEGKSWSNNGQGRGSSVSRISGISGQIKITM